MATASQRRITVEFLGDAKGLASATGPAAKSLGKVETAAKSAGGALADAEGQSEKFGTSVKTSSDKAEGAVSGLFKTISGIGGRFKSETGQAEQGVSGLRSAISGVGSRFRSEMSSAEQAVKGTRGEVEKLEQEGRGVKIKIDVDDDQASKDMDGFFSDMSSKAKAGGAAAGLIMANELWETFGQEVASDKTAATLGLTKAQAERAGTVAGNLFAGAWGESMEETNAATAAVISSIKGMRKASVPELEKVTSHIMDISNGFELDVPRVAQIAGQMIRTGFAKNANQGLDLLVASLQRVPVAVRDDLLDAVDEYGPFFQTLGLKGKDAFNILVKASQKGMYGIDKAGDALKEFTIRATDGSDQTQTAFAAIGLNADKMSNDILAGGNRSHEAFEKIVKGLLDIKDPSERARTSLKLFGTPMEDLSVREIPKFLKSLQSSRNELGKTEGAATRFSNRLNDNVKTSLIGFARSIRQDFQNIIAGLFNGDWSKLWKGLRDLLTDIKDFIKQYWRPILTVVSLGLALIVDVVLKHWDKIKGFFTDGWRKVKDIVSDGIDKVKDFLRDRFDSIVDLTRTYWGRVLDIYRDILTKIRDAVKTGMDKAREAIATAAGKVRDIFNGLLGFVRDKVVSGFSNSIGRIGDIWQRLKALAARPVNFVIETVWNNGLRAALDKIPGVDAGGWRASTIKYDRGGWTGPGGEKQPAGTVHADEFVVRKKARQSLERTRPGLLDHLNQTGVWPGYAIGGRVKGALRWAKSQDYQPYKYGGMGYGGWDCSGFMSGIVNFLRGNPLHRRVGSTASFPWSGFKSGPGLFTIGSTTNYGGSGVGHMAGNLAGVNVESRGGEGVVIGPNARGPNDPNFTTIAHIGPSTGFGMLTAGNGVGPAFPTGLFSSGLSAAMAIPNFIKAVAAVYDKVKGMSGRGGMYPTMGHAGSYAVGAAKSWGMDKLKSVGAFGENLATGAFIDSMGPAAANVTQAWNAIEDFDFPGLSNGGYVRARRGGTLVRLGEGGRDEIVLPVGRGGGGRTVLEVNVYLDGKALQQSLVKLKRRNGGIALGIA